MLEADGMNRPRRAVLILLALLVVAFAVTWLSLPGGNTDVRNLDPPAAWFAHGLGKRTTAGGTNVPGTGGLMKTPVVAFTYVPLDDLKQRIVVVYASAAAVVILLGLAFGAGRRTRRE